MKLQAHVGEQQFDVIIEQHGERVVATVAGRTYELELQDHGGTGSVLLHGTKVFANTVTNNAEQSNEFAVQLRGKNFEVAIVDPKRLRSGQAAGGTDHGAAKVVAAMPGKVVRVLVEVGAEVAMGDGIVVVEAMKMQNEMKSPKAGTVVTLNAASGVTVNAGDVLAVIE